MSASRFVLLAGTLALLAACGSSNSATPASPTTTVSRVPATGGTPVGMPHGAEGLGRAGYVPNPVTITAGSAVTWTNSDTTPHTATSNTGVFNSGPIGPGQSFSFTFRTAGTYLYRCSFHPGMIGSVVVQ
jgi:plastocyanin